MGLVWWRETRKFATGILRLAAIVECSRWLGRTTSAVEEEIKINGPGKQIMAVQEDSFLDRNLLFSLEMFKPEVPDQNSKRT